MLPTKVYKTVFAVVFLSMVLLMFLNTYNNLEPPLTVDEGRYSEVVSVWKLKGIDGLIEQNDNKPLTFLGLQRLLDADKTVFYTRMLNFALIGGVSALLFRLTQRWESCLFIVIPWFLNSMWLTVEIIEVFLILLGFRYARYQGIFVGLAMVFRPYAILYGALISNKQKLYVAIVGMCYIFVALYIGILDYYLHRIYLYAFVEQYTHTDFIAFAILPLMAFIGSKTQIFKYGVIASVPVLFRSFGHYFLPGFTLFFLSYLCLSKSEKDTLPSPATLRALPNPDNRNN